VGSTHPEGESPSIVQEDHDTSNREQEVESIFNDGDEAKDLAVSDQCIQCSEEGCGEDVLRSDLQKHQDLHIAENLALRDAGVDVDRQQPLTDKASSGNHRRRHSRKSSKGRHGKTESVSRSELLMTQLKRLFLPGFTDTGGAKSLSSSSARRHFLGVRGDIINATYLLT
jgi:hypothetical protein